MSRSLKLDIIKERPRNYKKSTSYWRRIRRVVRISVYNFKKDYKDRIDNIYHNPKIIVNDYDYSDYTFVNSYTKKVSK